MFSKNYFGYVVYFQSFKNSGIETPQEIISPTIRMWEYFLDVNQFSGEKRCDIC